MFFFIIVLFTLHRRQELVAHNMKWDNETLDQTWGTSCGHKSKDTTSLIAWRREAWKERRSPGGERRGKRKRQTIVLEKTREGHRQLDENWNRFKGNVGETFER